MELKGYLVIFLLLLYAFAIPSCNGSFFCWYPQRKRRISLLASRRNVSKSISNSDSSNTLNYSAIEVKTRKWPLQKRRNNDKSQPLFQRKE